MLSKSILSYQGPLTFSTIDWLLSEFKMAAQDHQISFKAYKKMISIMIEALENITKYGEQIHCNGKRVPDYCPSCQINADGSTMELITRNPIRNRDVEPLRERIELVNGRNREEIRELYRNTITNGKFSPKGGAGLGLIEMAKITGNKLECSFKELTDEYSLYTIRVFFQV